MSTIRTTLRAERSPPGSAGHAIGCSRMLHLRRCLALACCAVCIWSATGATGDPPTATCDHQGVDEPPEPVSSSSRSAARTTGGRMRRPRADRARPSDRRARIVALREPLTVGLAAVRRAGRRVLNAMARTAHHHPALNCGRRDAVSLDPRSTTARTDAYTSTSRRRLGSMASCRRSDADSAGSRNRASIRSAVGSASSHSTATRSALPSSKRSSPPSTRSSPIRPLRCDCGGHLRNSDPIPVRQVQSSSYCRSALAISPRT